MVGELDGTLTAYDEDGSGAWHEIASGATTLAPYDDRPYPSHVVLHDGLLYVGNRGPSTIAVLDPATLQLVHEVPTGGSWPRHFTLAEGALVVANQRSDELTWLPLDDQGMPRGATASVATGSPTCVAVPGG